ncbi:ketosynthase chain-length factor [Pseudonocardia nematodicida]|uniref:Ketosynthase chain-length factor n=1 Tax=Pseudonocardia nematodicida TaxID=1206997 RepID=A0ABV1KEC4_9PSEU
MSTAVTGLSVVAPTGLGVADYWAATLGGGSAIGPLTRFDAGRYPSRLAGQITGFEAADHLPDKLLPQTDRMTRLALTAADWAIADAGLTDRALSPFDVGVITASASGGFEFGQDELRKLWSAGSRHVSAYQSFAWFYAVNSGQISIRGGFKGPSGVVVGEQAGGLDALAQARRQIRRGIPAVVSGGVDASLCPWGWVAQLASGRISTGADPTRAYLPFDTAADGHVPGEGGAILVLEDAAAARARGRRVYGEIAGYGATFDPRPGPGRTSALRAAIDVALRDSGAAPGEVDVVFADGAAVPELDRAEAAALRAVFGVRGVPVALPKAGTGRLYSGGGPVDVAAALLSLRDGVIPPAPHVRPDPGHGLDLVVGASRPATLRTALVLARGHHGFNSALVLRR